MTIREQTDAMSGENSRSDAVPMGTKRCPFCAEEILEVAIKCRHCGEFLDGSGRSGRRLARGKGWYFATPTVVFALMCVGPLALPLVWLNPRYKPATKAIITGIIIAVTVLCCYLVAVAYEQLMNQISVLG